MATNTFSISRLSNLREKKTSITDLNSDNNLKLTVISQSQKLYQPSASLSNTRTSMRFLKGKIQKPVSIDTNQIKTNEGKTSSSITYEQQAKNFKLVLNDSPEIQNKKTVVEKSKGPAKRILILKEAVKEPEPEIINIQIKQKDNFKQQEDSKISDKVIKEQQIQESKDQNQNQLILCSEGCGRKFNKNALQKHAKACKIVFMSKRKEFNSQAKRVIANEQVVILKQNKVKEKKNMSKIKKNTKGFDKTGQNWKLASQQFRAVIKGIKKEQKRDENQDRQNQKMLNCLYCQKIFNEVFLEQHLENCVKKKEKKIVRNKK